MSLAGTTALVSNGKRMRISERNSDIRHRAVATNTTLSSRIMAQMERW